MRESYGDENNAPEHCPYNCSSVRPEAKRRFPSGMTTRGSGMETQIPFGNDNKREWDGNADSLRE